MRSTCRRSSHYAQILDISRDQDRAAKAMELFKQVVHDYPNSEYVDDSKFKIQVTTDQLAGKEMSIGRFYLNRRNYTAAINRFRDVLTNYQTTRHAEEALYRLTEAYMGLGITDEARDGGRGSRPQLPRRPVVQGRLCSAEERRPEPAGTSDSWISKLYHMVVPTLTAREAAPCSPGSRSATSC